MHLQQIETGYALCSLAARVEAEPARVLRLRVRVRIRRSVTHDAAERSTTFIIRLRVHPKPCNCAEVEANTSRRSPAPRENVGRMIRVAVWEMEFIIWVAALRHAAPAEGLAATQSAREHAKLLDPFEDGTNDSDENNRGDDESCNGVDEVSKDLRLVATEDTCGRVCVCERCGSNM